MGARLTLAERIEEASFRLLTGRNLIYNTSWEDPAVDRRAMRIGPADSILMITSGGCNVLDYALEAPRRIVTVDANPRQTALLELKLAGIRRLSHEDMFALFGLGWHADFPRLYREHLRADLSDFARDYWDRRRHWFASPDANFYTRGLTGLVMRCLQNRLRAQRELAPLVHALFDQPDLETQRRFYLDEIRPRVWTPFVRWFLSTPMFSSLVGVPLAQRRLLQEHERGMSGSLRDLMDELFCTVPANDNYFWGVYVFGRYHADRCPRYLTPEGFARLKAGLADRIEFHTCTVTDYLDRPGPTFTHAVLLDHMDWMSSYYPEALEQEWEGLLRRMGPEAMILFRSAHAAPPFLDTIRVGRERRPVRDLLAFRPDQARELSRADRVHTYASFHIATLPASAMTASDIDWRGDLRVLAQFLRGRKNSGDQAANLNDFYGPQAHAYDRFRERLLPGRRAFMEALPLAETGRVVDFGAGTGRHWLYVEDKLPALAHLDLVDLCTPLLDIARARFAGAPLIETSVADAATWRGAQPVDLVVLSYSLSMMPDWRRVLANAVAQLKPGGVLGVIDFCTLPAAPLAPLRPLSRWNRWFWPRWFAHDGVWLRPEILPALVASGPTLALEQSEAALPYLPVVRAPWFFWIGRPGSEASFP